MKTIRNALEELYGLFVEDGSLAAAILVWVALFAFVVTKVASARQYAAPALFIGLVVLLVENVRRSAKQR